MLWETISLSITGILPFPLLVSYHYDCYEIRTFCMRETCCNFESSKDLLTFYLKI